LAALLSQVSGKKCKYGNKYENLNRADKLENNIANIVLDTA
jgi:hypothetical protein